MHVGEKITRGCENKHLKGLEEIIFRAHARLEIVFFKSGNLIIHRENGKSTQKDPAPWHWDQKKKGQELNTILFPPKFKAGSERIKLLLSYLNISQNKAKEYLQYI